MKGYFLCVILAIKNPWSYPYFYTRLELNANMTNVGATFVSEAQTARCYRLWTISDRHPAMQRVVEVNRALSAVLKVESI